MSSKNKPPSHADYGSNDGVADWELVSGHSFLAGGQGTVGHVRHRADGRIGALKTLHSEHLHSRERRYRMQQEVSLLNLLAARGVPVVLSHNMAAWESAGTPLYAVIEWVSGPTLAEYCSGRPKTIETALTVVTGLNDIVRRCHSAAVLHRDIKPDNVILRNGNIAEPVLIDFGMGWAAPDEDKFGEFMTGAGQELGNRFLRLPEYAPGHHVRDTRSDVTMLVAVLFYLLTGSAPRILLDPNGRMPHESMLEQFAPDTRADPRWDRLCRVFKVGFQQRIDMRYLDTQDFANALASISVPGATEIANPLDEQIRRIRDLTESADGSLLNQCQRDSVQALQAFINSFTTRLREIAFGASVHGPAITEWGRAARATLYLSRLGVAQPQIGFVHQISFEDGRFRALYSLVGESLWNICYEGPLADPESLREAVVKSVDQIVATLLDRYASALENQVARMRQQ
jgi:serine/threonine protein kinase